MLIGRAGLRGLRALCVLCGEVLLISVLLVAPLSAAADAPGALVPHDEPYPGFSLLVPRGWADETVPGGPLTFASPGAPKLRLRVQRHWFDGELAKFEEWWRDAQVRDGLELSVTRVMSARSGKMAYVAARGSQGGKAVRVHAGLFVDRRRAFVVSLSGPLSEAERLRALAGSLLKGFEPKDTRPAPLLLARQTGGSLRIQPPIGWVCREERGGLLAALPSRGPLALIRVMPLAGTTPYDTLMRRELSKFPPPPPPVHGPLDLTEGRVTAYRAPVMSEGRRMTMLWTIAGGPGKYLEIAYQAEPEVFDVYLPVALRSLETLERAD